MDRRDLFADQPRLLPQLTVAVRPARLHATDNNSFER